MRIKKNPIITYTFALTAPGGRPALESKYVANAGQRDKEITESYQRPLAHHEILSDATPEELRLLTVGVESFIIEKLSELRSRRSLRNNVSKHSSNGKVGELRRHDRNGLLYKIDPNTGKKLWFDAEGNPRKLGRPSTKKTAKPVKSAKSAKTAKAGKITKKAAASIEAAQAAQLASMIQDVKAVTPTKRRGRIPGSKNKPKPDHLINPTSSKSRKG